MLAKNRNQVPAKIELGKDLAEGTLTEPTISRPTIADGGRIGFQEGGQTEEQPVENVQGMQEDVQTTYAALRQSLPDYISDNVVTTKEAKHYLLYVKHTISHALNTLFIIFQTHYLQLFNPTIRYVLNS